MGMVFIALLFMLWSRKSQAPSTVAVSPGGAQAKVALTVKRTKPPTQASTPKPKVPSCGPKHDVIKSWTVDKTDPNIVSLAKEGLLTDYFLNSQLSNFKASPQNVHGCKFKFGEWTNTLTVKNLPVALYRGVTESDIGGIIVNTLRRGPRDSDNVPTSVFVDVGMNAGWFTHAGAATGTRVIAYELQPQCIAGTRRSLEANNLHCRVTIHWAGVADVDSKVPMDLRDTCSGFTRLEGGAGVYSAGSHVGINTNNQKSKILKKNMIHLVKLSDALRTEKHIQTIKIDIEGGEVKALLGLEELLLKKRVHNIIVEISTNWWKRAGVSNELGLKTVNNLVDLHGFEAFVIGGDMKQCVGCTRYMPEFGGGHIVLQKVANLKDMVEKLTKDNSGSANFWFRRS